ncbi:MAG: aspartate aminotransferase family protein [Chthoniobacterales bacterium]
MSNYTFERSQELLNKSRNYIAGGVNSGIRGLETPVPLFFERGSGSRLWDVDGNEHIDFQLGQGALILGHAHPAIAGALAEQSALGTHWTAQSQLEIDVAKILCEEIPACDLLRFNNSATEALIAVTRLARRKTGRNKLLRFEGHYHGWNDEGLFGYAPAQNTWDDENGTKPVHPSGGILPDLQNYQVLAQFNNLETVARRFEQNKGEIAALLVEPVSCNNGAISPEPGFLEGLRKLCDENGTVLVFDETITGVRFGLAGAEGWSGVRPDIFVMGKAIGGGVPFALIGGKAEFMEVIARGEVIHAGTLNSNPLCLAASKATLTALKNDASFADRLQSLGQRLMRGLNELGRENNIPILATGRGANFHILVTEKEAPKNYREYFLNNDRETWGKFRTELNIRGVRTTERGLCFLSAVHTEADIDEALNRAKDALAAVKK